MESETMNAQELIHLHSLLYVTTESLDDHGDLPNSVLDEYHELDVAPTDIHKSKTDHKEAVQTLSSTLAASVQSGAEREQPPST